METRDQWYKPNLLYNIHWRPPKTQEPPKMVVKTVRFNPSVCTCGEHNCGPHYRMERKVVWINNETTNTEEDKKKGEGDSRQSLQCDQTVDSKGNDGLHNKEEAISEGYSNGKERCINEKICNKDITRAGFDGHDFNKLEKDYDRKGDKGIDSDHGDESDGGDEFRIKKEWQVKNKDSYDSFKRSDLQIDNGMERKAENRNSIHVDGLKIKDHSETGETGPSDNYNDNLRTDKKGKHGGSGANIEDKMIGSDGDDGSVYVVGRAVELIIVSVDNKPDGEKVGEDLKLDCEKNNCSLSTKVFVKNDDTCYGSADDGERYVNTGNNSGDGRDDDVTEEIYLDEEISPAFGIMSIYCRSELHYTVSFYDHKKVIKNDVLKTPDSDKNYISL